jgi:predicted flap endonuclease-1-like 5' DNA nuclease
VIRIVKKKEAEQRDPHVREAYIAENRERYTTPTPTPISTTPIPNPLIAPIPIPTPSPIEHPPSPQKELLIIKGINEKTASQLEKLGINNIDDLAKSSAKK